MRRLVERYGFEPNRNGYICCPFHKEDTPSLKVYEDSGWHCFGCGKGGDQISFVRELFGLSFPQALTRLQVDFGLAGSEPRPVQKVKREPDKEKQLAANYAIICRRYSELLNRPECL